ncbi:hypothetical protein K493DRAFT_321881, partial [Basidiobolus meristosporus CBS 931.73]
MQDSHLIPKFTQIYDEQTQTWKYPTVHYLFQDEGLPEELDNEQCIVVDLSGDGEHVSQVRSYSSSFQVTECRTTVNTSKTDKKETTLNLTIHGISKRKNVELPLEDSLEPHQFNANIDSMMNSFLARQSYLKKAFI